MDLKCENCGMIYTSNFKPTELKCNCNSTEFKFLKKEKNNVAN